MATTFHQRWRGLKAHPPDTSLLLQASSVHGFGMREPFVAVGIDDQLRVVGIKLVRPRRLAWFPRASFVLELPPDAEPPRPGMTLEMSRG